MKHLALHLGFLAVTVISCGPAKFKHVDSDKTHQDVESLQATVRSLIAQIEYLQQQSLTAQDMELLQSLITQLDLRIAVLEGHTNVVRIENPCGDAPGIVDEVLLRLSDGSLLASFSDNSNGKNTRFAVISAGTYMTTDGSNCSFSIDSDNNIN